MDNAGAIVLILFLCILGCACCAGGAWWAKDQGFVGGTKSRAYTPDPYEPHSVDHDFEHFDPDSRDAEGYHDEEGQDAYDAERTSDSRFARSFKRMTPAVRRRKKDRERYLVSPSLRRSASRTIHVVAAASP